MKNNTEKEELSARAKVELESSKTLDSSDVSQAVDNVRDIKFAGEPYAFKLLSKAWSDAEGWTKSTKAMNVPHGVIVQVSTQQGDSVAEAVVMIPGARVVPTEEGYCLQETPS